MENKTYTLVGVNGKPFHNMKKHFAIFLIFIQTLCIGSCILIGRKSDGNFNFPSTNNSNTAREGNLNQSVKAERIDDDTLLSTLISLENEWKQAKKSGQTNKLNQIYADEFMNKDEEGHIYTKADWIKYWSNGDPNLKSIEVSDGKLVSCQSNTAIITFKVTSVYKYKNELITETIDTDSFVFRDRRWQAISSTSKEVNKK